ncbi:VapE domain-containing protein [Caenispirillum bisanense]|uniref:Virulence-associated protein E n=1 Tax=Caenispirillum bisanense TaxID=414052 RepID=A0A286GPZ4_9PROT|nr:VapE domain-containing protein [Caenispirillum bisanense]SOD97044.1 Virulence-associated protein E [Caenispirillum bisanense]
MTKELFLETLEQYMSLPEGAKVTDTAAAARFMELAMDHSETMQDVEIVSDVLEDHTTIKATKLREFRMKLRAKIKLGGVPTDHVDFVRKWCAKNNIEISLDKRIKDPEWTGKDLSDSTIRQRIYLAGVDIGGRWADKAPLDAAWAVFKSEVERQESRRFLAAIAHCPTAPDPWDRVLRALLGDVDPDYFTACSAVLRGAVHRVKLVTDGTMVRNHIMPYLRSRQGTGKSTFMAWFFGPVSGGLTETTFDMFAHTETLQALTYSPIIFFDEVARADKADANTVKNVMTSETKQMRKLYGEATKQRIVSTFFGAGNLNLAEVFTDDTGSRRFFQIDVNPNLLELLPTIMQEIDPADLWRSVDETKPSPLDGADIIELLQSFQAEQKNKTPLESYLDYAEHNHIHTNWTTVDEVFKAYAEWRSIYFPSDRTDLNRFRNTFARVLKDGYAGKWVDRKHPKTRRMEYRCDTR